MPYKMILIIKKGFKYLIIFVYRVMVNKLLIYQLLYLDFNFMICFQILRNTF